MPSSEKFQNGTGQSLYCMSDRHWNTFDRWRVGWPEMKCPAPMTKLEPRLWSPWEHSYSSRAVPASLRSSFYSSSYFLEFSQGGIIVLNLFATKHFKSTDHKLYCKKTHVWTLSVVICGRRVGKVSCQVVFKISISSCLWVVLPLGNLEFCFMCHHIYRKQSHV